MNESYYNHTPARRHYLLWVLAATCLGAGLRLHQLDYGSFWLDELFTINGTSSLGEIHRSKALGYVPTYIGLRLAGVDPHSLPQESTTWREQGVTELVARLPTAIVGILTVPIIGLMSIRLLGVRGAILVTFLLAVAPWHIYWSQAARFYVPQFLFYTMSVIGYYIGTRYQSPKYIAVSMVCAVLAFLSQPTSLILFAVFAADWLFAHMRGHPLRFGRPEIAMGVAAAAICTLILMFDIWMQPANWAQFVDGSAHHQSPARMILGAAYMIGPALVVFAALTVQWQWKARSGQAVFLAAVALVPLAVFVMMSGWAFVGLRYAFVCLFGWLALVALGSDRLHRILLPRVGWAMAWTPLAIVVAGLALMNYIYFNSHGNFHARWGDAAAFVREQRQPGERVAAGDVHTAGYYMQDDVLPLPQSIDDLRAIEEPTWFIVEVTHSMQDSGRFWLLPDAELREVFPLRVVHVNSSVQVYKYTPKWHENIISD